MAPATPALALAVELAATAVNSAQPALSPVAQSLPAVSTTALITEPSPQAGSVPVLTGKPLALTELTIETWPQVFAQLGLSGVTRSVGGHCALAAVDGSRLALILDTRHGALFNDEHRRRIEAALVDYFGQALSVSVALGTPPSETPSARRLRLEDERRLVAVHDFTHDPAVQALVQRFGAEIDYESITPLGQEPR